MKKIIITLFLFSSSNIEAQPFINIHDFNYQNYSGYIVLNNGEKITGNFQYAFWEFPTYNLKLLSRDKKVVKRYYIPNIERVVLAGSDLWLTNKDSTYFIVHDKCRHFYRQLTFGNDFLLYDGFFNTGGYVGLVTDYFLIQTKEGFKEFPNGEKLKKWLRENFPNKIKWSEAITVQEIIRQLNGKV